MRSALARGLGRRRAARLWQRIRPRVCGPECVIPDARLGSTDDRAQASRSGDWVGGSADADWRMRDDASVPGRVGPMAGPRRSGYRGPRRGLNDGPRANWAAWGLSLPGPAD